MSWAEFRGEDEWLKGESRREIDYEVEEMKVIAGTS